MKIATKLFMMAALALMTAACSSNDENNFAQQPKTGEGITITAQLAPKSGNDATRAVAEGDNKIIVTWAENEHLAILYEVSGDKKVADARITKVDGTTGAATIEFTVEDGTADNTSCTLVYPYSAANNEHSGLKDVGTLLGAQDGTLNANLDVRVGAGTIHTTNPSLSVTTQPEAQFAIFKFTTRNVGSTADINVKPLTITTGTENFVITPADATSTFYAALPPLTGEAIGFVAKGSDNYYYYMGRGVVTFTAGKYYQSTIKMTKLSTIDLSTMSTNFTAHDGDILTGTLGANVKISIADNATVTLLNANINGTNNYQYSWAGLTCEGDATIILADGSTNSVKGFYSGYPGIFVPSGKTLIIKGETVGSGKLNASSNNEGAGIGGSINNDCGNIEIQGGVITATGGYRSAGIGSCEFYSCGTITITGGTVTATGGAYAAGIGSSIHFETYPNHYYSSCGTISITGGTVIATGGQDGAGIGSGNGGQCSDITIANTVKYVEAKRGTGETKNVGPGSGGSCGTVTIGGTEHWKNGNYVDPVKDKELLYDNNVLLYQP